VIKDATSQINVSSVNKDAANQKDWVARYASMTDVVVS
jgi:hypothetical protein